MRQFDILREPRGQVLDQLIELAVQACDRFTVERSQMRLSPDAELVYSRLAPFLMECADVSETPGSILVPPDTITLCTYFLEPGSAAVLREATDHLYGWVEPDLPQDLCFLRGSDTWLINQAADEAACLVMTDEEADAIRIAIPGLALRNLPSRDIRRH
jgi:hypothetical protein